MSEELASDPALSRLLSYRPSVQDGDGPAVLPPHSSTCLGCGPDAERGFHLVVQREGDDVVTRHVFTVAQSGAPGIAHGGAVATVVDDLLGFLLYVVRKVAVTRKLEVEYLRPVMTGQEYAVRGRVDSVDGRKVWLSCAGTSADGALAFRGTALFLEVPLSHFPAADGSGRATVAP